MTPASTARVLPAVLLLVSAVACGDARPSESANASVTVRDSAGVEIVELDGLQARDTLVLEPLWTVETVAEEPLFGVPTPSFLDSGRVGLVERGGGAARIHVLDAGTQVLIGTVGRAGEGPGELLAPGGIAPSPDGGFAVWDSRLRRVTYWNDQLEAAGSEPLPDLGVRGLPVLWPAAHGYWIWIASGIGGSVPGEPLQRDDGLLALWTETGVDTVTSFPGNEYVATGTLTGPAPWGDQGLSAEHPSGVWLGDTDEPAVRLFDADGPVRIVRWDAEPIPRTAADDAALMALFEAAAPPGSPPEMLETVRETLVVDRMPYWGRMLGTDDGRLWISTTVEAGLPFEITGPVPALEWVILDPEGVPEAEVRTPAGFEPGDIRDGVLIGVERDELGVERVRAFRVRPT